MLIAKNPKCLNFKLSKIQMIVISKYEKFQILTFQIIENLNYQKFKLLLDRSWNWFRVYYWSYRPMVNQMS